MTSSSHLKDSDIDYRCKDYVLLEDGHIYKFYMKNFFVGPDGKECMYYMEKDKYTGMQYRLSGRIVAWGDTPKQLRLIKEYL